MIRPKRKPKPRSWMAWAACRFIRDGKTLLLHVDNTRAAAIRYAALPTDEVIRVRIEEVQ